MTQRKLKELPWWSNSQVDEVHMSTLDKLSFISESITDFGSYRISFMEDWKLRFNGGMVEVFDSLAAAREGAAKHFAGLVEGLYEMPDSKWQASVKPLEWQKIDTWYATDPITNRSFTIFEEEGRAWVQFGGSLTDWDNVDIAKQQVDNWRADLIRSALED